MNILSALETAEKLAIKYLVPRIVKRGTVILCGVVGLKVKLVFFFTFSKFSTKSMISTILGE